MSSTIPDGAIVTSAVLSLYFYGTSNTPAGRIYNVYRITQAGWTESATWNTYDGSNAWTSSGGDYTATNHTSASVRSTYGWMNWTVTDQVQYALNSLGKISNFLIRDSVEYVNTYDAQFYSREYTTVGLRPQLTVTWITPSALTVTKTNTTTATTTVTVSSITTTVTSTSYSPTVTSTSYSPTVTLTSTSYSTTVNVSLLTVTTTTLPITVTQERVVTIGTTLTIMGLEHVTDTVIIVASTTTSTTIT